MVRCEKPGLRPIPVLALITAMLAAAACGRPHLRAAIPAPHPNGCYVMLYERPNFQGIGDVLDGPGEWQTLKRLPHPREDWAGRIRSLRVGAAATITVYTDAFFAGESQRFSSGTDHPILGAPLSGRIESLVMQCERQNDRVAAVDRP